MQNALIDELEMMKEEKRERKVHKTELIREWNRGNIDEWIELSSNTDDHEEEKKNDDDEEEKEKDIHFINIDTPSSASIIISFSLDIPLPFSNISPPPPQL